MDNFIDSRICPICHQPNGCQKNSDEITHLKCWCTSVEVTERLLQRIPLSVRGKACVCKACVEKYK